MRRLGWASLLPALAGCGDGEEGGAHGRLLQVSVEGSAEVAEVSERYLSVAVDTAQVVGGHFWAAEAIPQPGAGAERVAPYDFSRPKLRRMAKELAPAYLRIGGSEADKTYYDLAEPPLGAPPEPYLERLTREQWDGVNELAGALGFEVLFTLNAGPGPRDAKLAWTADNARELIEYTRKKQYPVVLWELGNEINGYKFIHGLGFDISAEQYAADVGVARALVDEADPAASLAGPSSAFWPKAGEMQAIYPDFMAAGGGQKLDVITWHYYPQQSRRCPIATLRASEEALLDPLALDEVSIWAEHVESLRDQHAPGVPVWLGETGNAQCGGEPGVSDAFVGGMWWLDQLGAIARRGQRVVVRQTLSGSNYGLIDEATLEPNPDYFNSLLWRRLMGARVLDARADDPLLRTYAHCARVDGPGAVTLLAINLARHEGAWLALEGMGGRAEAYVLTAEALSSRELALNGEVLRVESDGSPPELQPLSIVADRGIVRVPIPPTAYAFVVLPDAQAEACVAAAP